MTEGLIASISIPGIFLMTVVVIMVACEIGYLLGRRHHLAQADAEAPNSIGSMVGGLLSMLAFALALVFSMAVGEYRERKQDVVAEAAAIRNVYLFSDLLKPQQTIEIKRLLREYVDVRLQVVRDGDLKTAVAKSLRIHGLLWAQATTTAVTEPDDVTAAVAQSVVDLIDIAEQRKLAGAHSLIPESVWVGLLIITFLSMVILGLQVGFTGKRRLVAVTPLALAFAVLVTLVVDLDRPRSGFITVSQDAMVDVQAAMNAKEAAP